MRRELILGGMDEKRIARVVGHSSSVLLDNADPYDPINRRVSIIVMNKKAEEAATHDGGTIEVSDPALVVDPASAEHPAASGDPAQVQAPAEAGKAGDVPVEATDAGRGTR